MDQRAALWRKRIVQRVEWAEKIFGSLLAAAEARMADRPFRGRWRLIAWIDSIRYAICLTDEYLYLVQTRPMRIGTPYQWWLLKRPRIKARRADVWVDQLEDRDGWITLRIGLPDKKPQYMIFRTGWREEVDELARNLQALRTEDGPR